MRIAFIGQKGFPATWGGVEQHVDELARQLAHRGHHVTVFSRWWYAPHNVRRHSVDGVQIVTSHRRTSGRMDALVHALTSTLRALRGDFDVLHYHCMGPALVVPLARLGSCKVVCTIHGFDYRAARWGGLSVALLRLGECCALHLSHTTVVVARHLFEHYAARGCQTTPIPNGVCTAPTLGTSLDAEWNVEPGEYLLFVARLEANKRPMQLIDAFEQVRERANLKLKLVIVGAGRPEDKYAEEVVRRNSRHVLCLGSVHGAKKWALMTNAFGFVTPSEFEGLPIAVMEAMSAGLPILASDIPAHRELLVGGELGKLWDCSTSREMVEGLQAFCQLSKLERDRIGAAARQQVKQRSWLEAAEQLESTYLELLSPRCQGDHP